jgi:glycosyltransferase involved in cell wall biosynthesis
VVEEISVVMLTKNSQAYLEESLTALRAFDEIIIVDNGSTDNTLDIAKKFSNVKIFQEPFIGFGPLKNRALTYTSHAWVLAMDSDEILSQALLEEIEVCSLDPKTIYAILRENYYKRRFIGCCSWQNDYVLRLFHKEHTCFSDVQVHESLEKEGMEIVKLKATMKHYTYHSIEQLLDKLQFYSTLYAKENVGIKSSSPLKAVLHGAFTFIKNYIFQKGFLYGYEGLLISACNANGTFYKYMKLYEASRDEN